MVKWVKTTRDDLTRSLIVVWQLPRPSSLSSPVEATVGGCCSPLPPSGCAVSLQAAAAGQIGPSELHERERQRDRERESTWESGENREQERTRACPNLPWAGLTSFGERKLERKRILKVLRHTLQHQSSRMLFSLIWEF